MLNIFTRRRHWGTGDYPSKRLCHTKAVQAHALSIFQAAECFRVPEEDVSLDVFRSRMRGQGRVIRHLSEPRAGSKTYHWTSCRAKDGEPGCVVRRPGRPMKKQGRRKSDAPPDAVLQVILYKFSVFVAQFQCVGHFVKAHAARHEFLNHNH